MILISVSEYVPFKLDSQTNEKLEALAIKKHISKSALIRKFIDMGMEKELASESVDYIRSQLHDEIKATCDPQFERLAKLEAKIGYQSVSSFYLLAYIMDKILPSTKRQDFDEIVRMSKAMAVAYLKVSAKDLANYAQSEDVAIKKMEVGE